MLKPLLTILAATFASSLAMAQVDLNPDHPERYVVQEGDTLWDIAERFLRDPWLWPEIWQVNSQIDDPHLIYPGDVISLSLAGDRTVLSLERGGPPGVRRLSPHMRRTPLREAIRPIPLEAIRPFLDKRTILEPDEYAGLPYVVAVNESYLTGNAGQNIYVRDLDAQIGESYAVVRPTVRFTEVPDGFPWGSAPKRQAADNWHYPSERTLSQYMELFWDSTVLANYHKHSNVLGYEVMEAAVGEVVATGDPTTLRLTSSTIEVMPGDMVIPVFSAAFDYEYFPHAATELPHDTRVIGLSRALFGAGRNQVVAINRGAADGIENGHVMRLNRPEHEIDDEVRYPDANVKGFFTASHRRNSKIVIPEEYSGHLMVFKTFQRVSYGLIVRSAQAIKVGDRVREP